MRSALGNALVVFAVGARLAAAEPAIPPARGYVTDTVGVISPGVQRRIETLVTELQQKTGAEIAVLTVESTAPLDDLSYAIRVAEVWKPGQKSQDNGVVVLVATKDRKLRIVTGYGVEGPLPDGLVGQIQDQEIVPLFKAGRIDEGVYRGVVAMATRIAADRGVSLTGVAAPRPPPRAPEIPWWVVLLIALVLLIILANSDGPGQGIGRRRGPPMIFFPGPSRFPGGWSDGGGGFGGFGGGGFGGGGAGRSW